MIAKKRLILFLLTLMSIQLVTTSAQLAFSNVTEGDVIANITLPTLYGDPAPLMVDDAFNVFIFLKPVQQHSLDFIEDLAALEKEFADKPVRWAAILPDRFDAETCRTAFPETALAMPILMDPGDRLYGELGVILHPSIAITNADHVMLKYLHYHKVNFRNIIRAYLKFYLGEIDETQLATALDPPAAVLGGERAKADRNLKLADRLFQSGKADKALEMAEKITAADSTFAAAWILIGDIKRSLGEPDEARAAYEQALTLEPANSLVQEKLRDTE